MSKSKNPKIDDLVEKMKLYKRALKVAAMEAYQSDVVAPLMEDMSVGEGKEYATPKDWIDDKIDSWIEEADLK